MLGSSTVKHSYACEDLLPKERGFTEFFNRLIAEWNPDFIVSIARKGPRLLEYLFKESVAGLPVISEKAIDFLSEGELERRRVLLFDDIVIWGSTMELVRRKLSLYGCETLCASYAVSGSSFFGDPTGMNPSPYVKSLDLHYFERLGSRDVNPFCNSIAEVTRGLGKPYDLDYPIFRMRLSAADDAPDALAANWLERLSKLGKTYDVTTPAHRRNAVLAFTVLTPPNLLLLRQTKDEAELTPEIIQKLRLFVSLRGSYVNIVPMALLRWKKGTSLPEFAVPLANSILRNLTANIRIPESWKDDAMLFSSEPSFAEFRALLFVHSLLYGTALLKQLLSLPNIRDLVQGERFQLDELGLRYLFGPRLAQEISGTELRVDQDALGQGGWFLKSRAQSVAPARVDSEDIYEDFRAFQGKDPDEAGFPLRLDSHFGLEENLDRVCRSLHYVVDEDKRVPYDEPQSLLRLRRGLSYRDLLQLLRTAGLSVDADTFSHAIDVFNDSGMLVPINMLVGNDLFLRGCRNGENDSSYLALRLFVREALTWQKKQGLSLTRSAFHKMFVILSRLFPDTLPIGSTSESRGPLATYIPALRKEESEDLTRYLTRHSIISVRSKRKEKERHEPEKPRLL